MKIEVRPGAGASVTVPTTLKASVVVPITSRANANLIAIPGPPGPAGPAGPPGGTYEFTYVSALTPPPGAGELRMNSADQAQVTRLYVSTETDHGVEIDDVLAGHDVGYRWYFYDKADPSIRLEYRVTATPINNGTWYEYEVVLEEYFGPIPYGPIYGAGITNQVPQGNVSYRHYQAVADTTWTIQHNLGYFPSVTTVDSSKRTFVAEVEYVDVNTVVITLSAATAGEAYLS